MTRPKSSMVFSLNDQAPSDENFMLPDLGLDDRIGAPIWPSEAYFVRPDDLQPGQKLVIRLNPQHPLYGQVFGYIAPKGQCILDLNPNECWLVPSSPTDYDFAHQGTTVLASGAEIRTANIGGGVGHAAENLGWKQVPRHYEATSTQMAAVRYGEDDYGVYAAGVAVPTMTLAQALELTRSATSGDWRWVEELNAWDFMGSCLVNLPGLPVYDRTRLVMAASAQVLEPDRAMLVTFNGAETKREPDMGAGQECSCGGHVKTAAAVPNSDVETKVFSADDAQQMIASALEARDAQWESRLTEVLSPVIERLDAYEPIVLSVLDGNT